ncbi:hypothetical protein EMMF5_000721 [Cystobasidiomycetes sp. EMM_F5]
MDILRAEVDRKRKADEPAYASSNGKKYLRKGDIEREEREEKERKRAEAARSKETWQQRKARKELEAAAKKQAEKANEAGELQHTTGLDRENTPVASTSKLESSKPEAFNISNAEAIRRLRGKGQPIRLFGESDKDRRLRLRALELIEERTDGQQNDFRKALEGMDKGLDLEELQRRSNTASNPAIAKLKATDSREPSAGAGSDTEPDEVAKDEGNDDQKHAQVDLALVKTDPRKVYPQIYYGIKRMLKEWEQAMQERPDAIKRSTNGKLAAATQMQSAEYIKPLLKSLRKRELEPDVLQALAEIVHFMQRREYLRATDSYLRLSIGNAPWPIGVTMVGIHERSSREKIHSNQVAHVLNDEVSRKYIQSLKRIMTFAQSKYPPDDLSQRMG